MVKKIVSTILIICLSIGLFVFPAFAATQGSRVTIGADNTSEQINEVYKFFRIDRGSVPELQVTNNEEKRYLSGFVPEEKIGDVALSCVYIQTSDSGGIELETFNINWVTDDMYRNALQTAGITNAKVIVAAYKPVSGTGALTGIYKAYEDITGQMLDETVKTVAAEELVVTGDLQEVLGNASPEFMNDLKAKLEQTKDMNDEEIRQLIVDTANEYGADLSEDWIQQILGLIKKMNELNMDPDTFIELAKTGQGIQGFFEDVGGFFQGIGDFFSGLIGGGNENQ